MIDGIMDVSFDWKATPDDVLEQVNVALKARNSDLTFERLDDGESDSFSFVLMRKGEKKPTYEEYHGLEQDEERTAQQG